MLFVLNEWILEVKVWKAAGPEAPAALLVG